MVHRCDKGLGAAGAEAWEVEVEEQRFGRNFVRKEGRERAFAVSMMGGDIAQGRDCG